MIKYSELENDFTIDCDGCGNFYVCSKHGHIWYAEADELYRFCSEQCMKFVLGRMDLIKKNKSEGKC